MMAFINIRGVFLKKKPAYLGNFTGENISEGGESVVHGLVINALVQVLDEDVSDARPD